MFQLTVTKSNPNATCDFGFINAYGKARIDEVKNETNINQTVSSILPFYQNSTGLIKVYAQCTDIFGQTLYLED